jgi:glycosyltransferase involved in cell wall biosynthesis
MISVIIPTYNRLELLKITLASLAAQQGEKAEWIVVDDHSTDGTWEYLQSLTDENLVVLRTQGKGPGAARNTGLGVAQGNFVKFFDSDDVLTINSLDAQLRVLQPTSHGLVYSPYVQARWTNGQWRQADVVLQYRPLPAGCGWHDCMRRGFFTFVSSMLFRRELLREVGPWRTDLIAYEDWDFLWRVGSVVANGAFTNECAIIYRLHGNQTTGNVMNNKTRDADKLRCLETILNLKTISQTDRLWLRMEHRHTRKQHQSVENDWILEALGAYKRLSNKLERWLTGTNWERMHGPCANREVFERYIALL